MSAHVLRSSRLLAVAGPSAPAGSSSSAASLARAFSASPASLLPPKKVVAVRPVVKKKQIIGRSNGRSFVKPQRSGGWGNYSFDRASIPHLDTSPDDFADLPHFTPANLTAENIGEKLALNEKLVADIKTMGFPSGQENVPFTVPRELTLEFAQRLEDGKSTSSEQSTWLLNGGSGGGKSQLMLQTVAYALQSDIVVMYMPRAYRHTNSRSSFHYNSETQIFHQPYLSSELLGRLVATESNRALLSQVKLARDYTYTPDLPAGTGGKNNTPITLSTVGPKGRQNSVADLAALGASNQDISVGIFEDVLDIIARQSTVPFFLALDVAQAYFTESSYQTPEGHTLQPYHLSVPRVLLEYISGRKQFARGSIMLALSPSHTAPAISPSLQAGLELAHLPLSVMGGNDAPFSPRFYPLSPETALQSWHVQNARALEVVNVPDGMKMSEAKGLWNYGRSQRITNSDEMFVAKYVECGGNPREFWRSVKYTTL